MFQMHSVSEKRVTEDAHWAWSSQARKQPLAHTSIVQQTQHTNPKS